MCLHVVMAEFIQSRVDRIASGVLGAVHTKACGEDYYSFEIRDAAGNIIVVPRIWIDPDASDRQIGEKLRGALNGALHPETLPDDLSVPNLKSEESGA
jgi:hypothetical protein